MATYMIVLRLIHIFAGIVWAGWAFIQLGFIEPALKAAGPAGGAFMQALTGKTRLLWAKRCKRQAARPLQSSLGRCAPHSSSSPRVGSTAPFCWQSRSSAWPRRATCSSSVRLCDDTATTSGDRHEMDKQLQLFKRTPEEAALMWAAVCEFFIDRAGDARMLMARLKIA
jgi:hypothetical protein